MKIFNNKAGQWIMLLLLMAFAQSTEAQSARSLILKKTLDGGKQQLAPDSMVTVQDSVYFDPAMQGKLDTPYAIKNVITFMINEYTTRMLPAQFSATIGLRIIYTRPDHQLDSIEKSLTLNYDTGQVYTARNSFVFSNSRKVTVKVLSVSAPSGFARSSTTEEDIFKLLILENQMIIQPAYVLDCEDDAVKQVFATNVPNTDETDELPVSWPVVTGADEYDLEWAYIDSSALLANRYGNPVSAALLFLNNATRVTVTGNSYRIPLLYDNGGRLYFRVRAVQQKTEGNRLETDWSSDFSGGLGSFDFCGHQRLLNWQASVDYAEEGKRKAVVQYFDGSLRSRQSVTKDNTTDTTLVAETLYDYQGRAVIQVMPATSLNNAIKYVRGFNKGLNDVEYDKQQYDLLDSPDDFLDASAAPMATSSGASRYYSPANPRSGDGIHSFIPDGGGYVFTETEYTQDKTGRISRQGGVGPVHKLGSNHETKYYYGSPSQDELDALFGTEVGNEKHYFKNMVRDANGQYAVTYLDMSGRTIATALAGSPDSAQLDNLSSNVPRFTREVLSYPGSSVVKDLVMESHNTKLVATDGNYEFHYTLTPPVLQQKDCDDQTICYNGLYELQITITDDAFNQRLGGKPFDTIIRNFDPEAMEFNCNTPPSFDVTFTLPLTKGSYEITKRLRVARQGLEFYRDQILLNGNVCKTLQDFIQEQRELRLDADCEPTCQSCTDSLGTWSTFRNRYMQMGGIAVADSASFRGEALAAYKAAEEACMELCGKNTELEEIRRSMLEDVTPPSGQYADISEQSHTYSIFRQPDQYTLPAYRRETALLNEAGQPDAVLDETTNTMVRPHELQPEQFSDNFKQSWAEGLLKYHPEYCKLLELEKHKASLAWDHLFEATDTYAEAKTKGYLNPTANGSFAFPVVTAGQDPLSLENTALKTRLESLLTNYNAQSGGNNISMWSMATASVKCNNDNTCISRYNTPAKAFNENDLCTADLDMAWRSFRQLYLLGKKNIIDELTNSATCIGPSVSAAQIRASGKVAHFNTAQGALSGSGLGFMNGISEQAAGDSAEARMERIYDDNCRSYAKLWVAQLAPCKYPASVLENEIIPKLIAVCKEGADANHVMGASTVKPSSTHQYRSFEDVLDEYNSQQGITDPLICNKELINAPAPYDKQRGYYDKAPYLKPDECECDNLKQLVREYEVLQKAADTSLSSYIARTRGVTIAQADLDDLLEACTDTTNTCTYFERPVRVPVIMQCNIAPPCVSCVEFNDLYNEFTTRFPGVTPSDSASADSTQQLRNTLFENFMNNKTGFKKYVWEYLAFKDSCLKTPSTDTTICRQINVQTNRSYNSGGSDLIYGMTQTSDGGFVLAGRTTVNGVSDGYLLKTDAAGNRLWAKKYGIPAGNEDFSNVRQASDGGLIAIGTMNASVSGNKPNAFIVKTDALGEVQWSRRVTDSTGSGEHGTDIIETSSGQYAFSGRWNYSSGATDWLVGVLSNTGEKVWLAHLGGNSSEDGVSITEDNDTLLVSGGSALTLPLPPGFPSAPNVLRYHGVLMKFNRSNGSLYRAFRYEIPNGFIWAGNVFPSSTGYKISFLNTTNFGGANGQPGIMSISRDGLSYSCHMISRPRGGASGGGPFVATPDGGYFFAPNTNGGDAHLMKVSPGNTVEWSRQVFLGVGTSEQLYKAVRRSDGGYAAAGIHNNRLLLVLADAIGSTGCADSTLDMSLSNMQSYVNPNHSLTPVLSTKQWALDMPITAVAVTATEVALTCRDKDTCETFYAGPMLCGSATALFPSIVPDVINNCTDSTFFIMSAATELYEAYVDSLRGSFEADYVAKCLEAEEHFTVEHNTSEYHYTLYYYDQAGALVKTVPPAGVKVDRTEDWLVAVKTARAAGEHLPQAHTMATEYRYNTLGGVVAQLTPDGGTSHFWYDRLGRLAISQNAKQQLQNAYSYILYDALGRVTEAGEIASTQGMTNEISRDGESLVNWMNSAASTKTQITKTVYDIAYDPLEPVLGAKNLRNRIAWMAVYNTASDLENGDYATATFYDYDIHGNVSTLVQDYKSGAMSAASNRFKKISYKYDLLSGKVNEVIYQPDMPDVFYHRYHYDAENRLTDVETSRDGLFWEKDGHYKYYLHGPLARVVLGQQQVQGLDYAYTLQGWMKGINGTTLSPEFEMGKDGAAGSHVAKDVFGFSLHYFGERDYSPVGGGKPFAGANVAGVGFRPLFNGNIGAISMNMLKIGDPLLYVYRYDVLNRITGMDAKSGLQSGTNIWMPVSLPDFKEEISYDGNGNILAYSRRGNNTFASKPLAMDNLSYTYETGKNRLQAVTDDVPDSNYDSDIDGINNYTYDAIGNLTADAGSNISNIEWSMYGKIKSITRSDNSVIRYTYDAAGNRISKEVDGKQSWYVRDATGQLLSLYKNGNNEVNAGRMTQSELYMFGEKRLGVLNEKLDVQQIALPSLTELPGLGTGVEYSFVRGRKMFELNNHLGNVLATVSDKKKPISIDNVIVNHYEPYILSATDYYPFGMQMTGRNWNSEEYRYGFNGKENDNEIKGNGNQQDYGFRIYDPRLGKFLSVDPITSKYPELTPYQFASNRVIDGVDLEGLEFGQDENVYTTDYRPVFKAADFGTGANNLMHNLMAIAWNNTIGGALETSKSMANFTDNLYNGKYNSVTGKDLIDGAMLWQEDVARYHTKTPIKEQLADFGEIATDWRSYEGIVAAFAVNKFSAFRNTVSASTPYKPLQSIPNRGGDLSTDGRLTGEIFDGVPHIKGVPSTTLKGEFDFVIVDQRFFFGKRHTFLSMSGSNVEAAGTLMFKYGNITEMTNATGHYQTTFEEAANYLRILQRQRVDIEKITLKIYGGEDFKLQLQVNPNSKNRGLFTN